jgi:hypothetical protein
MLQGVSPRGLDHIVHAVRDLDAAAAFYQRIGFTVGARNLHAWGTHNHIVQMPGFFIELLTVADPDKLGDDGFSKLFGAYTRDFLERHEGLALLFLESKDAAADENAFANAGIAQSDAMRFEREAKRPDGSAVKVAFSLTFAQDAGVPWIHFATCQQHFPDNFWNPAFQNHANGARGVVGAVMVAGKPAEHRDFISTFTGAAELRAGTNAVVAKTPRGELAAIDPVGFRSAFGHAPPAVASGARLAALRLRVGDAAAVEALLHAAGVPFTGYGSRLVIDSANAMGATIVFEETGEAAR